MENNKPKKPRAKKKQPTPEELKEMMLKGREELKQILDELKKEKELIKNMPLKQVLTVVDEAIADLTEDLEEVEENLKELENKKD